jgi:hypothetical protein
MPAKIILISVCATYLVALITHCEDFLPKSLHLPCKHANFAYVIATQILINLKQKSMHQQPLIYGLLLRALSKDSARLPFDLVSTKESQ